MKAVARGTWGFAWDQLQGLRLLLAMAVLWRVLFRLLPVQLHPAVMLLLIDPWMAMLPLCALPLQVLATRFLQARQGQFTQSIREGKSSLTRRLKENLDGLESVQSLGAEPEFIHRIQKEAEVLEADRDQNGAYSSGLTGTVWALSALALAGSWWLGASRVVSGEISTGQLVAFVGFVSYLAVPLRHFARLARETRRSLNGLQLVAELLQEARADRGLAGQRPWKPADGGLKVNGISFAIGASEILRELTADFPTGEFIWVRGRSGTGKSTLLRLLAQFEYPTQGTISLDGQVLRECEPRSVRRVIGLVPQFPAIFTGTLSDNLRLGRPGATVEELWTALRQAGLVKELPEGLDTQVGEGGRRLSGGESQRLAIARAFLLRPRILLLDEPTAALDPESEAQLMKALAALCPEMTVIMVAHDVRSPQALSRVLVLEDGELFARSPSWIAMGLFCFWYLAERYSMFVKMAADDPFYFQPLGAVWWMKTPLSPSGHLLGRYGLVDAQGGLRHSTLQLLDARNVLSLRYGALTLLLEARNPSRSETKLQRSEVRQGVIAACAQLLRWCAMHEAELLALRRWFTRAASLALPPPFE